jgi:hypothetical protein
LPQEVDTDHYPMLQCRLCAVTKSPFQFCGSVVNVSISLALNDTCLK